MQRASSGGTTDIVAMEFIPSQKKTSIVAMEFIPWHYSIAKKIAIVAIEFIPS